MHSIDIALLCAVIAVAAATDGHQLKCYQCKGISCADPYTPKAEHEQTCTPSTVDSAISGIKDASNRVSSALGNFGINVGTVNTRDLKFTCAKVVLKEGEIKSTSRTCAAVIKDVDFCTSLKEHFHDNVECSQCEGDLCNSASAHFGFGALAAAVAIFIANFVR